MADEIKNSDEIETVSLDDEQTPKPEVTSSESFETTPKPSGNSKLSRFKNWYKNHKKLSIPLTLVLLLAILLVIPSTRYKVLGLFIKKDFSVVVVDSETQKPVSDADVSLDGTNTRTDKDGKATIHAAVGKAALTLTKKYYKEQTVSVFVSLSTQATPLGVNFEATGRQVPVKVIDKITNQPVENAEVSAAGTTSRTDKDGKAIIVLPQDKPTIEGAVKMNGYNDQKIKIKVTEDENNANTFQITRVGKLYFLSKLSGKIDVVKTNLDGSARQTVLAGTGKEDETNTVLLASRDWKYLALLSKREGSEKVYLIDTATDKLSTVDEGNATFSFSGWLNDNFIYTVDRKNIHEWQNGRSSIKSFNASSKKLTSLNNSKGVGTNSSNYAELAAQNIYLTTDKVVFASVWNSTDESGGLTAGKKNSIISVNPDGSDKRTLKTFNAGYDVYVDAVAYTPNEIYFAIDNSSGTTYLEYEDGQVKAASGVDGDKFYSYYPTYLLSPSGKQTSWYEPRDGKNTLFIGDANGGHGKEIASLTEYVPYGWYSDDYLLYSKNDSELYIVPAKGPGSATDLKVTDYHKPDVSFAGYGGGYGGF